MYRKVIAQRLVDIADELDSLGLVEEANEVDSIVVAMMGGGMRREAQAYQSGKWGVGQTPQQFFESPAMVPAVGNKSDALRKQMEISRSMDPYQGKYKPSPSSPEMSDASPEVQQLLMNNPNYQRMLGEMSMQQRVRPLLDRNKIEEMRSDQDRWMAQMSRMPEGPQKEALRQQIIKSRQQAAEVRGRHGWDEGVFDPTPNY